MSKTISYTIEVPEEIDVGFSVVASSKKLDTPADLIREALVGMLEEQGVSVDPRAIHIRVSGGYPP